MAQQLSSQGWASESTHNVYFTPLAEASPHSAASMPQRSAKRAIAYDLLPHDLPLRVVYESAALTEFVRRVLGKPALYRSADPLDALEIAVFEPGEKLGWHFHNSEFSTTIMLQMPDGGGEFQFIRALRSDDVANEQGVWGVLKGEHGAAETLATAPGTLALFHGYHAMHRVMPVTGLRPRINAVLTYGERPDMTLSPVAARDPLRQVVTRRHISELATVVGVRPRAAASMVDDALDRVPLWLDSIDALPLVQSRLAKLRSLIEYRRKLFGSFS